MPKIGFVGGGQMASALVGGAIESGFVSDADVAFAEPSAEQRQVLGDRFPGCTVVKGASALPTECDKIVLAVKPHILLEIDEQLSGSLPPDALIVSIAAGISLYELEQLLNRQRVARVMPNTPCLVGRGASAVAFAPDLSTSDRDWVSGFLSSVGKVVELTDPQIHGFTGIAGSSPAYVYMFIEALSDGGVAQGLPRAVATEMAAQAVLGAASMVLETKLHPGQLKDQVTSPGGTTIAAIRSLEEFGMRSAIIEAVSACSERSRELSDS